MVSASDGSAFTGAVTVSVTGDAGVQATGSVGSGACTHEGNGYHTYAPAQAETNYNLVAFTFTGTGAIPATLQIYTITGDAFARLGAPAGASVSADVAAVKVDTAAILVDTGTTLDARIPAALVGGRMDSSVGAMAADVLTDTAINANAITAAKIADGALDRATFAADTGLQTVRSNTAQAGAAGTITLDAAASATDDFYNGAVILLTGGTGVGQARVVSDYVGATKVASLSANWATAPDNTSTFAIVGRYNPIANLSGAVTVVTNLDKSNYALSAAGMQNIWDLLSANQTTVGSVGKQLVDNLNATVSSRASQTSVDTIDDFIDTEVAAILDDTGTTLDDMVDDLETRLSQTLADKLAAHALSVLTLVVDTGSTTTAVVFKTVNGAAASGTDDFYNGAVIVFTSGALAGQRTSISDYVGATKTATVVALTGAPAEDVTGVIV